MLSAQAQDFARSRKVQRLKSCSWYISVKGLSGSWWLRDDQRRPDTFHAAQEEGVRKKQRLQSRRGQHFLNAAICAMVAVTKLHPIKEPIK
jgi:hypothetical protein